MTRDKFFEALGALRGRFEFDQIGRLRMDKGGVHCDCPVVAVARLQAPEHPMSGASYWDGGKVLGLPPFDALVIACAADVPNTKDLVSPVRARLLEVLGLSEWTR